MSTAGGGIPGSVGFPNNAGAFVVSPAQHLQNEQKLQALEQWLAQSRLANNLGLQNHYLDQVNNALAAGTPIDFATVFNNDTAPTTATIEEIRSPEPPRLSNTTNRLAITLPPQPVFESSPRKRLPAAAGAGADKPQPPQTAARPAEAGPIVEALGKYRATHQQQQQPVSGQQNAPAAKPPVQNSLARESESTQNVNANRPSYGISPFASAATNQQRAELGGPARVPMSTLPAKTAITSLATTNEAVPSIAASARAGAVQPPVVSGPAATATPASTVPSKPAVPPPTKPTPKQPSRKGTPEPPPIALKRKEPDAAANVSKPKAATPAPSIAMLSNGAPLVNGSAFNGQGRGSTSTSSNPSGPSRNGAPNPTGRGPIPAAPDPPPSPSSAAARRWQKLQHLLNVWQKAVEGEGILDIPSSHLRCIKKVGGLLYFFKITGTSTSGLESWVPPSEVATMVSLSGQVEIFVAKHNGRHALLTKPLPPNLEPLWTTLTARPVESAPDAQYPDHPPPPHHAAQPRPSVSRASSSSGTRTPKDVKPTFLAHDILRALGKTEPYKGDDEYVREAKRQAIVVEGAQRPVAVATPVHATLPVAIPRPPVYVPPPPPPPTAIYRPMPPPLVQTPPVPTPRISNPYTSLTATPKPKPNPKTIVGASTSTSAQKTPKPKAKPAPLPAASTSAVAGPSRMPLFLPDDDERSVSVSVLSKSSTGRRVLAYVEVPPAPEWVRKVRARERAARSVEVVPMEVDIEEVPDSEPEREMERERERERKSRLDHGNGKGKEKEKAPPLLDLSALQKRRTRGWYQNVTSEMEAVAMSEAMGALRDGGCRCQWFGCETMLNSLGTLLSHVHVVHVEREHDVFRCEWDNCGMRFANVGDLALHVELHVTRGMPCGYDGCEERLGFPSDLVLHNQIHAAQGPLRSSRPQAISRRQLVNPEVPDEVPDWGLEMTAVGIPHLERDRHEQLGPWVLRSICAPTDRQRIKRYNAARRLPSANANATANANTVPDMEFVMTSEMSFSSAPSRAVTRFRDKEFRELEEEQERMTREIRAGRVVLWPSAGVGKGQSQSPRVQVPQPAQQQHQTTPTPTPTSTPVRVMIVPEDGSSASASGMRREESADVLMSTSRREQEEDASDLEVVAGPSLSLSAPLTPKREDGLLLREEEEEEESDPTSMFAMQLDGNEEHDLENENENENENEVGSDETVTNEVAACAGPEVQPKWELPHDADADADADVPRIETLAQDMDVDERSDDTGEHRDEEEVEDQLQDDD
ncbi:C2H2-type domain-containing protein [Mycena chlorophos]|uniref:C2H2-type domain-containing protein n=1 Tax=Mycena chlorophos TaxID=658473 RepID=A0A8H6S8S3_MYCCL|nr:C2H2-type domain-containing protein [Mycena chlorophos]